MERERLEKQRAAEQAVHKHFEESLRLAQQKRNMQSTSMAWNSFLPLPPPGSRTHAAPHSGMTAHVGHHHPGTGAAVTHPVTVAQQQQREREEREREARERDAREQRQRETENLGDEGTPPGRGREIAQTGRGQRSRCRPTKSRLLRSHCTSDSTGVSTLERARQSRLPTTASALEDLEVVASREQSSRETAACGRAVAQLSAESGA
uniref:Jumonji domain containing 1B n=1 Tax=Apis cerana TaxID=7461 RepID=V9IFA1_APICE